MFRSIDVIEIFGRRGCGKSYLCQKIQNMYPRLIIFDSLGEYNEEDFGENVFYNYFSFSEFILKTENENNFRALIKFDVDNSRYNEEFHHMLRLIYHRGNLCLVIEEIQNFCSPHYIPHFLLQLFLTGRHQNLAVILTTQRPGTLNKNILSQATHIFCGSLHSKNDVREVSQFLGEDADKLTALKDRQFYWWRPGQKTLLTSNNL